MASRKTTPVKASGKGLKTDPKKDIGAAVREVCLSLPETEETFGHGSPDFKVIGGKVFATYAVNHHGDGHLALWLRSPPGAQTLYVDGEPEHFYVPPYVGPSGWLGVDLDKGLSWNRIVQLVQEAYAEVAPKALSRDLGPPVEISPPGQTIDPEVFDPFVAKSAQKKMQALRSHILDLPEVTEDTQWGNPCFRAGKKNFCTVYFDRNPKGRRMQLSVWAGPEGQATLTFDKRYSIPAYTGRNGWLNLDVQKEFHMDEIQPLLENSYRHFALKRMLKALDG